MPSKKKPYATLNKSAFSAKSRASRMEEAEMKALGKTPKAKPKKKK